MLRCSDGSYYTGITTNVLRRFQQHQDGKGSKYVKSRLPCELVWHTLQTAQYYKSRSDAMKVEHRLKKLPHKDKHELALFAEFMRVWAKTAKEDPNRTIEDVYKLFYESKDKNEV